MRRHFFAFVAACTIAASLPAAAAELETKSQIDAVTVYPDGATVTRIVRVNIPAGDTTLLMPDFPQTLDPSSLRVQGESGVRLVIGAVDSRTPRPVPPANLPDIDKRIQALRDQRAELDGAIAAATARRKFVERFANSAPAGIGDKGEARPLAEWRAAFAAIAEETAMADAAIRDAQIKQRDIDRDLSRLQAERNATPPRKLEVRIDLNASAPGAALLRVTYAVRGARWTPVYDARLDTGTRDRKPSLELLRRAEIAQTTGEDWTDIELAVSTVRTARGGAAPELQPLIVRYYAPVPRAAARSDRLAAPTAAPPPLGYANQDQALLRGSEVAQKPAEEQQAAVDAGGFQVVFRIPGRISVPAGQGNKSFRIATATIAPELMVHTVPSFAETAFLQASFKHAEDAPLLAGRVAIYRDGIFVGHSPMAQAAKDETVRLGFGADEKVKVTRAVVRQVEGTAGIISSSKTDEREYKTIVRNGHDFPIRVTIEDQVPVSETADIQVEVLPVTTQPTERDVRDRRGVMEWSFELKPGESREIKLGWRARWPKDRVVQFGP